MTRRQNWFWHCHVCGNGFASSRNTAEFCSAKCRQKFNRSVRSGNPIQRHRACAHDMAMRQIAGVILRSLKTEKEKSR